jgi:hypothetical protein
MIIRFVLTKTTSFRFMSARLIGRNSIRFGSVRLPLKSRFGSVRLPLKRRFGSVRLPIRLSE